MYYSQVDEVLSEELGGRSGKVLLTDEKSFLAYYPYHAYQAFTSHYANPLGDFARRNEEIEGWSKIAEPKDLLAAMDNAEKEYGWKAPDALLMRGQLDSTDSSSDGADDADSTFTYLVADDIYPSQPNVRFRAIHFDASAFSEGWDLHQVGPFVIAVRQR